MEMSGKLHVTAILYLATEHRVISIHISDISGSNLGPKFIYCFIVVFLTSFMQEPGNTLNYTTTQLNIVPNLRMCGDTP
jgi:hypothetical protein